MELSTSFSEEIRDSSDILCDSPPESRLRRELSAGVEDIFSPPEKRAGGFQNVSETVPRYRCGLHQSLKGRHIVESTSAQRCNDYCRDVSNGVFYGCFLFLISNYR